MNRLFFTDKTGRQAMGAPNFPDLEGRFKIELFNARTGKLEERIEQKNIVTNAVKDIFKSNYFGGLSYAQLMPIFLEMFGGVLCFEDPLNESATDYYPPLASANRLIAHAGKTTYVPETDPEDRKRGNPNFSESHYITNGYSHVWDFAPSQGNGVISAIALTHKDTGSYWMYNPAFNPLIEMPVPYSVSTNYCIYFFDAANNKGYGAEYRNSTFTIYEVADVGYYNDIGLDQQRLDYDPTNSALVTAHVISGPTHRWHMLWIPSDNEIHLLYVDSNGSSTVQRKIVNTSTWTVTDANFTVQDASLAMFALAGENESYPLPVQLDANGYMYLQGSNGKVYKFDYSDPTDVSEFTTANAGMAWTGCGNYGINLYKNPAIVDGDTASHPCTLYSSNTDGSWYDRYCGGYCIDGTPVYYLTSANRWREPAGAPRLYAHKLFMSTVRNLSPAVEKQATQSMKITYSIAEV